MGPGEKILRKVGEQLVILLCFFAGTGLWLWLLVSTGNVYFALAVSVAAVSGILGAITFRIRRQTGRWWFVEIDKAWRSRILEPPLWNTSTTVFWEGIERQSSN